jgi:hypothetical protein
MSSTRTKACKKGEILREGYSTSVGTRVKPACIKATSDTGKKAKDVNAPIIREMLMKEQRAEKLTSKESPKSCKSGEIRRSAFMRESKTGKTTAVPAACIKSRGADTKVGLINPKTGERTYVVLNNEKLHTYGYTDVKNKTLAQRHASLDRAYVGMKKEWLPLFRHLNYLAVLNKNHPLYYNIFNSDRDYVKAKYAPK